MTYRVKDVIITIKEGNNVIIVVRNMISKV